MQANIIQLITYPIKSCAAIQHENISINEMGLLGDRQMMLVDANGQFLTQRKYPQMALIKPKLIDQNITLIAPGMEQITIKQDDTEQAMDVTVWKDSLKASVISQQANQWFSDYLGIEVSLVSYSEISYRGIDPDFSEPGQTVAFADGFPVLIVHQSSLNQLNKSLSVDVPMSRFRPNIIVKTSLPAWDELNWTQLSNKTVNFILPKPCSRCVMTGVQQESGIQTGTEVLKTLKQKFSYQNKAVFGINAIPQLLNDKETQLSVGMDLTIEYKRYAEY